jgi:hypothetical protein
MQYYHYKHIHLRGCGNETRTLEPLRNVAVTGALFIIDLHNYLFTNTTTLPKPLTTFRTRTDLWYSIS